MRTYCRYRVRPARLIGQTLLCGLLVCCLTDVACSQGKQAAYDVTRRRIDLIPAGVVIGDKAPEGWTNLIIKSRPRPGAGDVKELSANADRLSRLLFTAILAEVKEEGRRFKLVKVAVGETVRVSVIVKVGVGDTVKVWLTVKVPVGKAVKDWLTVKVGVGDTV